MSEKNISDAVFGDVLDEDVTVFFTDKIFVQSRESI